MRSESALGTGCSKLTGHQNLSSASTHPEIVFKNTLKIDTSSGRVDHVDVFRALRPSSLKRSSMGMRFLLLCGFSLRRRFRILATLSQVDSDHPDILYSGKLRREDGPMILKRFDQCVKALGALAIR